MNDMNEIVETSGTIIYNKPERFVGFFINAERLKGLCIMDYTARWYNVGNKHFYTMEYKKITDIIWIKAIISINEKNDDFIGIVDTGSTNSSITKEVINRLGLKPIGEHTSYSTEGRYNANEYTVDLKFGDIEFHNVSVAEVTLPKDIDFLIGMDIISQTDFSITNSGGKTYVMISEG